jgi:succinate dehydrogenase / fumarate reductase cytochrome b subunit
MSWISDYLTSSIGKKQTMAISGLLLVLFLFVHLAGNLTVFAGPDATNGYAVRLRQYGPLLWVVRLGLLASFLVHVMAGLAVAAQNRQARLQEYRVYRPRRTTWYARWMLLSGVLLLAYVLFHLAHFTFGLIMPQYYALTDPMKQHDVYRMVVASFQNVGVSFLYMVAMFCLAMHLAHGVPSFFQTLGFNHPNYQALIESSGPVIAILLFVGYCSIPVAVLAGVLELT